MEDGFACQIMISGILVCLIIGEDIVSVHWEHSRQPLMEFLIEDSFLWQLVVYVFLRRDLELSMYFLAPVEVVIMVSMGMTTCTSYSHIRQSSY